MLKEQSNNFCLPHDVLPCDDVLIRFGHTAHGTRLMAHGVFVSRHAGTASARTLRLAAVSRWVRVAGGQPLDVRLRKASSPTMSFRVSIRIYLFVLTKTLNSKAERTDVFVRNCKDKQFNQLLYYC